MAQEKTLYLVFIGSDNDAAVESGDEIYKLSTGLFLVRTDQTRSKLYHAVKHRLSPDQLLVAPLADHPKFKGMAEGALKWLRS